MFVAGKMFADAKEAKAWIEGQTTMDERRHWIVLQLEGEEPAIVQGLADGSIGKPHIHTFVGDVCACGARDD